MATQLKLLSAQLNPRKGVTYDMTTTAGAGAVTRTTTTTAGGTKIQLTLTAGGAVMEWVTGPTPAGGFTLTSTDVSVWAAELANTTNASLSLGVFKLDPFGRLTELGGSPFAFGSELTTTMAVKVWTGNVTDTVFNPGDRLLVRFYATNVGTMNASSITFSHNAASSTGFSWFNIAETVTFGPISTITLGGFNGVTVSDAVTVFMTVSPVHQIVKAENITVSESVTVLPIDILTSLVSFWKLDEASGDAIDSVGTNHLTAVNAPTSAAGKFGPARLFARASTQYFTLAHNTSISAGDINFTFSCWLRPDSIAMPYMGVFTKFKAALSEYHLRRLNDQHSYTFSVGLSGVGSKAFNPYQPPGAGEWVHIVVWHDTVINQLGILFNGQENLLTSVSQAAVDSTAPFYLGARDGGTSTWEGLIEQVGYWKRALTRAEMISLYNYGSGWVYPFDPLPPITLLTGLISYWKLDETSGSATDSHGGNTLTATGSPGTAAGKVGNARTFPSGAQLAATPTTSFNVLQTGNIDFTISCWAKTPASFISSPPVVFGKIWDVNIQEFYLSVVSNKFVWKVNNGLQEVADTADVVMDTWYHFVCWYDSVNNQLGLVINNGTPFITAQTTGVNAQMNATFRIGHSGWSNAWGGLVDELGFWKRVLTPEERTAIYNGGAGLSYPFVPPTVGKYWVGGTDNWNATAGSKWSLASGGAGGAAVPTAAENVFFDAASGAGTITVSADVACKNLDFTGFTGTLAGSGQIASAGTVTLVPGMTLTYYGQFFFTGTATAALDTGGKTIGSVTTTLNAGGTFNLLSDVVMTGQLAHNVGTFNTNNYNISANNYSWGVNQTRTINLGTSTLTITSAFAGENMWSFDVATGCTFNCGTSTIIVAPTGDGGIRLWDPALNFDHYNVWFQPSSNQINMHGWATYNGEFRVDPAPAGERSGGRTVAFESGMTSTFDGTLNINGEPGNLIALTRKDASGEYYWHRDAPGSLTVNYVALSHNHATINKFSAGNSQSGGNNTNWTFLFFDDVTVSDSSTVEVVTASALVNFIIVSDGVTVFRNDNPPKAINKFDGVTVSDFSVLSIPLLLSVSDSVSVADIVAPLELNASDIYVSESVTVTMSVVVGGTFPNAFDTITASDSASIRLLISLAAFDTVTASESVTVAKSITPSVFDTITASEGVTVARSLTLTAFDTITISESVTVVRSLALMAFDTVTASDTATVYLLISLSAFDGISASDASVVTAGAAAPLQIADDDTVTASDFAALYLLLQAVEFETVTVSDASTVVRVQLILSVFDGITASDVATVVPSLAAVELETVTTSEFVSVYILLSPQAFDGVTASDVAVVAPSLVVVEFETVTASDGVTVSLGAAAPLLIPEFDTITASDASTVARLLVPAVFETITVSEAATVSLLLRPEVFDQILIFEEDYENLVSMPSVFDSIGVSEAVSLNVISNLLVADAVTVSEAASVRFPFWTSEVSETVTASDFVSIFLTKLYASVFDGITVTDASLALATQEGTMPLGASDTITTSEFVSLYLLLRVSVGDGVTASDASVVNRLVNPARFDTITTSELVTVRLGIVLSVFDSVTASELVARNLRLLPAISETITVSDQAGVRLAWLVLDVADLIEASDAVSALITSLQTSSFDTVGVSDTAEVTLGVEGILTVAPFDTVTLADAATVSLGVPGTHPIVRFDTVTVSEAITVRLSVRASIFDTVTVSEQATVRLFLLPSVGDLVTTAEVVSIRLRNLVPSVFDAIDVTDTGYIGTARIPLSASDAVLVTEAADVRIHLSRGVFDTVTVSDFSRVGTGGITIDVFDLVTVSEAISFFSILFITASNTVTVSEFIREASLDDILSYNVEWELSAKLVDWGLSANVPEWELSANLADWKLYTHTTEWQLENEEVGLVLCKKT